MTLLNMNKRHLDYILEKALNGITPSYHEVIYLLSLRDNKAIEKIMLTAQQVREQHFGKDLFLYGFIYFSTYCRNHCAFCYYRKTNQLSPRYRKTKEEVLEIAMQLADSGVHLVDLTMGEDPMIHDCDNFSILGEMIKGVKEKTGLPVMISPGVVPDEVLYNFSSQGVDWYALYQETHNPDLFKKLRLEQSFAERSSKRIAAQQAGMLVEDGILLGVGETTSDRADAIFAMKQAGVHQARVMSLVPQQRTPMSGRVTPERTLEYLCIAVMRLLMPDKLIPASLDVDGIKGLKRRLEAGANVITSIIPPSSSLAGVSQSTLDIEQGLRTVPEVKRVLQDMGLEAADSQAYQNWILEQKAKTAKGGSNGEDLYSGWTAARLRSCLPGSTSQV